MNIAEGFIRRPVMTTLIMLALAWVMRVPVFSEERRLQPLAGEAG